MLMVMADLSLCGDFITIVIGQDHNIKMVENDQLWLYEWSKMT